MNSWLSAKKGLIFSDLIENGIVYNFSDSVLREQPALADFQTKGNRVAQSVSEIAKGDDYELSRDFSGGRLFQWDNVVMLQITDKKFNQTEKLAVDYLIVSNNAFRNLREVVEMIDARQIIIDSSNSKYVADILMRDAEQLNYPVYSVLHKGAFITDL